METTMYDYVMRRLEATKGKWKDVAAASGVSYRTVQKIATRLIADPGVSHVQKLCDYFREIDANAPPPPQPPSWPGA